ncbi:MAG: GNAT family N-acetyltransferase [Actinobacteria bacterium]|nr:GNAT family N-acetyltransferase [Actinomycetota bacterium]
MRSSVERDHVLPDGTTIHLRPLRPDDRERLLAMWDRTSERSRRDRFLGPFTLTSQNVGRFTDLDEAREFALAATVGRGQTEQVVGVARWACGDDPQTAEFAALVEDAYQARGIGTALVRSLAELAHGEGIERLTGDVLATNSRMLGLIRDVGLEYEHRPEHVAGVLRTAVGLQPTPEFLEVVAAEEKRAARAALTRFFQPRSIAVAGASRDPGSIGGMVFRHLMQGSFHGAVYPVNVSSPVVQSVAAYPSLHDLPEVPDLVVVCVPAPAVNGVVDEAGELGVRAVCIISAGFAEAGDEGRALQRELMETAHGHGLRIVGPNCMGLMNTSSAVRMNATFSEVFPRPGGLAFSSQSGALGLAVLTHADDLGLGMSTFVSVGNKADISGNDLLLYWEDDPDTDVILLYLESFGNPRRFSRIARRISRNKPIVAVKSGRTRAGARAAASHTASLAGGDVAVEALFNQTGVIRTDTLQELFDVAALLSSQPPPSGPRVAILTNAGGPGILAADACESNGLHVPAFSDDTRAALSEFLPPEAGIGNPVDLIASATAGQYGRALRTMGNAEEVDAVFVIFIPAGASSPEQVAQAIVDARADIPDHKPVISVFMSVRGVPAELAAARIPSFAFPEDAARALGRVARWARWRERPVGEVVRPDGIDADAARGIVEKALGDAPYSDPSGKRLVGQPHARQATQAVPAAARRSTWLDADDAEALLRAYGVPLAPSRIVTGPEEAAAAQRELGAPVAVKVAAPIHKSDVGGLALGIATPEDAAAAVTKMRDDLTAAGVGEHADRFLVQEMVGAGVEMVVGVSHDESFGPLVMVGMGGTLVELIGDVSVRVTPLTDADVAEMLEGLRMRPLLTGYRGSEPVDLGALSDLLYRINAMVEDLPEIAELDLNPVFARPDGVVAVDVRCRVADGG